MTTTTDVNEEWARRARGLARLYGDEANLWIPQHKLDDFLAPNPPFCEVVEFAFDHAQTRADDIARYMANWRREHPDSPAWGAWREECSWQDRYGRSQFHWGSMLWDMRRRYGDDGRELSCAVLGYYEPPGRPEYLDEAWEAADRPAPRWADESLVSRWRPWRKDCEIKMRAANWRLNS